MAMRRWMMPSCSIRRMRFQHGVGVRPTLAAMSARDSEASTEISRRISRSRRSISLSAAMRVSLSLRPENRWNHLRDTLKAFCRRRKSSNQAKIEQAGELFSRCCGVLLRRTQGQAEGVHPALLGGAEFRGQGAVNGAGAGDAVDALKGAADQQHAVMRLAAGRCAGMPGVPGTVVLDLDDGRRERLCECCAEPLGAGGGWVCHDGIIGRLRDLANRKVRPLRIVVIGTPGAGKTTLARAVAARLALPHIELDAINWQPGWRDLTRHDPDEFVRR